MKVYKPVLNLYRKKRIRDNNLVITDQGQWCFLEDNLIEKLESQSFKENSKEFGVFESNGLLITDNNISGIIKRQRNNYLHLFLGTSLHIVVPTARCNHKCVYCHSNARDISAKEADMDIDVAKKVVDFIFQSPSKQITIEFQGGEPLLRFDLIREIISYIKEKNLVKKKELKIDIVSNLSLMEHDILKYLMKENVGICTSLDGPEKVHNKNRILTGANSYKKATYWINEIKTNYNYPINALMVTTKYSLDSPEEIVEEYIKNNLSWIRIRHLDSLGYAKKNNIGYSAGEYLSFWKKAADYIVKRNKEVSIREGFIHLIMQKLHGVHPNYADFESPCGAIISQLAYSYNGDIYTCDEGRQDEMFKLGNVENIKYKELIKSNDACSMILSSLNDSLSCSSCVYKPFCGVCPVCNFAEEGNLIPKLPTNMRCTIYKGIFDFIFTSLIEEKEHKSVFESWLK